VDQVFGEIELFVGNSSRDDASLTQVPGMADLLFDAAS
jgi:hypothetical protein